MSSVIGYECDVCRNNVSGYPSARIHLNFRNTRFGKGPGTGGRFGLIDICVECREFTIKQEQSLVRAVIEYLQKSKQKEIEMLEKK